MSGRVSLIEQLFAQHADALQSFLRRRVRRAAEVPDLAQEVYLRMLRVGNAEMIRNPEAYLYTVATNLMKEQMVLEHRQARVVDIAGQALASDEPGIEWEVDQQLRTRRLREVLGQLSPKCRAVLVMQYRYGMTYEEIGRQLGISSNMVKKYLAQGLAHCRRRMARMK